MPSLKIHIFILLVTCFTRTFANNADFQAKLMAYSAPFYNQLTQLEKQQFLAIYSNPNFSKQQTIQQMIQFAQHLPLDIQIQFSIWGKQMQDITQATDDYAKTLPISQQAKPYADQILSIYANPNIGYSNEDTQIEQVLDQVPDNVKSELSRYIMDVMAKFLELWVQACVNVTQGNGIGNGAQPGINF